MKELEQIIGYEFKDKSLMLRALSHTSYINEVKSIPESNERLGFLGDSVLSIIVSEYIFRNFKQYPEGELTKLRASLVCEKSLAAFAREIELGKFLFLGKGEQQNGGRERPSILADAFEAFVAAIYLDKKDICVRSGDHCDKKLKDELKIKNTLRISLYFYNTKKDCDRLIKALKNENILEESLGV